MASFADCAEATMWSSKVSLSAISVDISGVRVWEGWEKDDRRL
jgi:hypothetical protein